MESETIFDALNKWNAWDKTALDAGFPREIVHSIAPFLDGPEIIALKGVRRSGKSTVMLQLMNYLLKKGARPGDILYLNFEEPLFYENRGQNIIERIFRIYRERVNPGRFAYVFLDEVQEIPHWEKWVRTNVDLKQVKIIVTGSSSGLLGTEYSTLLTGRNVSFTVYPLNFREFLDFKGLGGYSDPITLGKNKDLIRNALREYMQFGGFPEAVLRDKPEQKEKLLKQYFEDILYRDIVWRHKVRDIATLKNIAMIYMTEISNLSSYTRIKNSLGVPLDVVRSYSSFLDETYLVKEVKKHSFKVKEQLRNPKKVYAIDTGIRNAVSYRFSEDFGRLAENVVFLSLLPMEKEIYYYKGTGEVDFVVKKGMSTESLIQVSMAGSDRKIDERELKSLIEGMESLRVRDGYVVTEDYEETISAGKNTIKAVPLWKWLLQPS